MLCDCFKSRQQLEAEIMALRYQLNVLQQRAPCRPYLRWGDRALFRLEVENLFLRRQLSILKACAMIKRWSIAFTSGLPPCWRATVTWLYDYMTTPQQLHDSSSHCGYLLSSPDVVCP
jgi:hypothetical protein